MLVAAGEAAAGQGSGVLLAIDEIQYLTTQELAGLISAIHRTTQLDLPVVLVGAGLPQLPKLTGEAKSYAERLFEFPTVGPLEPDDAAAAITIPADAHDVTYSPTAVDLIVTNSNGYPYFLQEWGHHVWNTADVSPIDADTVVLASDAVIDHLDRNFFLVRFDRLTPKEKNYLRAMAELGGGPHRSGDIAHQLGVRVEQVGPRRNALIKKGMIYSPAHGATAFTVPLFDDFLRRSLPD